MSTAIAFYLFTASWCGPCQVQVEKFKDDPRVAVIDVETAYGSELSTKLEIRGIPIFACDDMTITAFKAEDCGLKEGI